jgi:transposase
MTERRSYTDEFRLDAISLVVDQGYARAEAARNLGIGAGMLGRWIRKHEQSGDHAFRGNGKLSPEQQEIRSLKTEVKRLKMERDILKKATAFFAAETK